MVFESERPSRPLGTRYRIDESISDYRERLERERKEIQQRRLDALAEQVSVVNIPSERIRIWERLHGLSLPRNPTHKLVVVIAAATDLQLEQVQEVQRLRQGAAGDIASAAAPLLPKF